MKNSLYIIGASGHGKVVADIARLNGYKEILFLDDDPAKKFCGKYPVVGTSADAESINGDVFVAIGNAEIRERFSKCYENRLVTLIHPDAVIAEDVQIGYGTAVMAGTVINPGTVIGKGCIINTCASVDHDNSIGDYCHVSVGAHLAGTVRLDDNVWIGIGAVVNNNLHICNDCTIGAGAVVVDDLGISGTYIGVPAAQIGASRPRGGVKHCLKFSACCRPERVVAA